MTLTEVRSSANETAVLLELTQQDVDDSSKKLIATRSYLDQLAQALEYEEKLDVQGSETVSTQAEMPLTPASQPSAEVDPQGSMEWTDPTGKKHTVKFSRGRVLETIE